MTTPPTIRPLVCAGQSPLGGNLTVRISWDPSPDGTLAPSLITKVDADRHNATLLADYIVSGPGTDTWCRDCGGAVVVRPTA